MHNIFMRNTQMINIALDSAEAVRIQNYDRAVRKMSALIALISQSNEHILSNVKYYNQYGEIFTEESYTAMLNDIMDCQEKHDYILLADILEMQFVPFLTDMQNVLRNSGADLYKEHDFLETNLERIKDESLKNTLKTAQENFEDYILEVTNSGDLTMKIGENGCYLHSNVYPVQEGNKLAAEYYSPEFDTYIVWGLGLGYHVKSLFNMEAGHILVYETDINIIRMAFMNMNFPELTDERLKVFYDPDFSMFTKRVNEMTPEERLVIHAPSLKNIKNKRIYDKFNSIFISESSIRNTYALMVSNFRINVQQCEGHHVDEIISNLTGKKVIIVAAGPSLDKNADKLKMKDENTVIIAVGTALRKLVKMGIEIDYAIVSDANYRVRGQISGLENMDIPLLILSSACKNFAMNYNGQKYLITQDGFDCSVRYAQENNKNLYETGGSVSTTAIGLAIKGRASQIIFAGLDLAYTDGYAHASGTSRRMAPDQENLIKIKGQSGQKLYASNVFIMYRTWIENKIKEHPEIEFINATEGGAIIHGAKNHTLESIIKGE